MFGGWGTALKDLWIPEYSAPIAWGQDLYEVTFKSLCKSDFKMLVYTYFFSSKEIETIEKIST